MSRPYFPTIVALLCGAGILLTSAAVRAAPQAGDNQSQGTVDGSPPAPASDDASRGGGQSTSDRQQAISKIYVPYKELKGVFEKEGQGYFCLIRTSRSCGGQPKANRRTYQKHHFNT
jgi:hypothetical protein